MSLMLHVLFSQHSNIESLFCCASSCPKACLWIQSVYDFFQYYLPRVAGEADGPIIMAQLKIALFGNVIIGDWGHAPDFPVGALLPRPTLFSGDADSVALHEENA